VTVAANQTGDANHEPAAEVSRTFMVSLDTLWTLTLDVDNAEPSSLTIGMAEGATDIFDEGVDVPAEEPEEGGYARLKNFDDMTSYREDYRGVSVEADYFLIIEAGEEDEVTVSWDAPELPDDRYLSLWEVDIEIDTETDEVELTPMGETAIDMSDTTDLIVPANDIRVYVIRYADDLTFDWHFHAGWNLKSLPLLPDDPAVVKVLGQEIIDNGGEPRAMSDDGFGETIHSGYVWGWNGKRYQAVDELAPDAGYWIYTESENTVMLRGLPLDDGAWQLHRGWNLIGAGTDLVFPEAFAVHGRPFGWDPLTEQYRPAAVPLPGLGYWIYSLEE